MPTILDLAAHADLPAETVLRVLLRQPTNETARRKVGEAVSALGMPDYPRPNGHVEVLPAVPEEPATDMVPAAPGDLPALAEELRTVFQDLLDRLDRERRERIDDLALTTDLMAAGWTSVDRRLGRIEKIVERLGRGQSFGR